MIDMMIAWLQFLDVLASLDLKLSVNNQPFPVNQVIQVTQNDADSAAGPIIQIWLKKIIVQGVSQILFDEQKIVCNENCKRQNFKILSLQKKVYACASH